MARRRIDRTAAKNEIVESCRLGLTLADACASAGVHVATVCRWGVADAEFRDAAREARREARQPPPGSLARRMSRMPGASRREDGRGRCAVLAVRPVALLPVGELAAPAPAELPAVRRGALLVAQPQVGRLRGLRNASFDTLTGPAAAREVDPPRV